VSEPKLPVYGYNSFYANRIISGRRVVQGTFAINFTGVNVILNILANAEDSILASKYDTLTYRCGDDTTGLGIGNSDIFYKAFDLTISYGNGKSENPTYNGCYQTLVGVQIVEYRQALDTEGNPILDMYSFIAKDIRYDTKLEKPETESKEEPNDGPPKDRYVIADKLVESEMNKLIGECTDTDLSGFIVQPLFYPIDDEKYCINLSLDSMNNSTKTFKDVQVTLIDQSKNINYTCNMKDINVGSSSTFELKDSLRDIGVQLNKIFEEDPNYDKCQCTIKFIATIDEKETEITHSTILHANKS
jgi:hypothetical protein